MIYSEEINKVCGLCLYSSSHEDDGEQLFCSKKKKSTAVNDSCAKFKYDIFKKPVRRKRRLKTDFNPEDFQL